MVGTKRFSRHGLVISALGHVGLLAAVLLYAQAGAPHDAIPPDAMLVEMVTPQEMPRLSGAPSPEHNSGTQQKGQSQTANAERDQPPVPPSPPTPQRQPQQKDQRQAQRDLKPPPKPQEQQKQEPQKEAPPAPAQKETPPLTEAEKGEVAMVEKPADAPSPSTEETPEEADSAAGLAQLALLGGRLGGGFAAPPINSPLVGYDFTTEFRERVSACVSLPPGVSRTDKINVSLRVFLNRDGTLAAEPQLLDQNPSAKQLAIVRSFIEGLHKCQPYTMLPQEHYKQWKQLDLMVYPLNSFGG